jgi:hypothetical protein
MSCPQITQGCPFFNAGGHGCGWKRPFSNGFCSKIIARGHFVIAFGVKIIASYPFVKGFCLESIGICHFIIALCSNIIASCGYIKAFCFKIIALGCFVIAFPVKIIALCPFVRVFCLGIIARCPAIKALYGSSWQHGDRVGRVTPCAPSWRISTHSLASDGGQRTARPTADLPFLTAIAGGPSHRPLPGSCETFHKLAWSLLSIRRVYGFPGNLVRRIIFRWENNGVP